MCVYIYIYIHIYIYILFFPAPTQRSRARNPRKSVKVHYTLTMIVVIIIKIIIILMTEAGSGGGASQVSHLGSREVFLYEEFARLAETRLARNGSNYLNIALNHLKLVALFFLCAWPACERQLSQRAAGRSQQQHCPGLCAGRAGGLGAGRGAEI